MSARILLPILAILLYSPRLPGWLQDAQPPPKPPDQNVIGKVVDRDGKPVVHAEVTLAAKGKTFLASTNEMGSFNIKVPAGDYGVTVKSAGKVQTPQPKTVKVESNQLKPNQLIIDGK